MTNARWQRWAVAVHLLLIAGWMAWFWDRSLALALAGVAAMLQGADNRFIEGVAHVEMAFHPRVLQDCLALLEQP